MHIVTQKKFENNKKIRIGIIGIGFGQHVLLPAFRSVGHAEVRAIAATSLERAEKVAELYHIPCVHASWQAMVNDPDIDALVIATPPLVQQEIIMAALCRHKHLFCEKPLGMSLALIEKFAMEAKQKKLANMVDFEFCAIPAWQTAKNFLEKNALGYLKTGVLNWQIETHTNRMKINNWKTNSSMGGGVLFNFATHFFYNMEWLFGLINEVIITKHDIIKITDETIHGILKFKSGLILTFCIGSASYFGSGHRLEIYGEQGSLKLINTTIDVADGFTLSIETRDGKNFSTPLPIHDKQEKDGRITAVSVLAERFIHWILTGESHTPDFSHGCRVNALIHASQASLKEKCFMVVC